MVTGDLVLRVHTKTDAERAMKLKLKEKELRPVQLRLVLPAAAKQMLDQYAAFVGQTSGRGAGTGDRGRDAGADLWRATALSGSGGSWRRRVFSSRTRAGSRKALQR
jgi:hypothetical protein